MVVSAVQPVGQGSAGFQDVVLGDDPRVVGVTFLQCVEELFVLGQRVFLVLGEQDQEVGGDHACRLLDRSEQPWGMGGAVNGLVETPIRFADGVVAGVFGAPAANARSWSSSSSVTRSAAQAAACPVRTPRIVKLSRTSAELMPITVMPLRGATRTRPSNDSSSNASRTGVRLVANSAVIASRSIRVPAGNAPVRMRSRSSRAARSRTVPPMSMPTTRRS